MVKSWHRTLARKILFLFAISFLFSLFLFLLLHSAGATVLKGYFHSSEFIYNAEASYIKEFSEFVEQNEVSAKDTAQLFQWKKDNKIRYMTVFRKHKLLYDSSYPDGTVFDYAEFYEWNRNRKYFHPVKFADGQADVFIYDNFEVKYYLVFYTVLIIFCTIIWFGIFLILFRKDIEYIQRLGDSVTKISEGILDSAVPYGRKDELGQLASGLDKMRLALIETEQTEKEMKEAQEKRVLGMAHDLRTPLTGLMTYLEIAKKQSDLEECIIYVDKAFSKTIQIRELSNQLFDFFLIDSGQNIKLELPENAEYALGEYFSELCVFLQNSGFEVKVKHMIWKSVQIQICLEYMGRIVDNLFSNICKYADVSAPVEFSTVYENNNIGIRLKNKCAKINQYVHGTGVGMKNVETMMQQMNGSCQIEITSVTYTVTLWFPAIAG